MHAYLPPSLPSLLPLSILSLLSAIVRGATDCVELISQKLGGKVLYKRDLTVFDASNTEVRLTLWGDRGKTVTMHPFF